MRRAAAHGGAVWATLFGLGDGGMRSAWRRLALGYVTSVAAGLAVLVTAGGAVAGDADVRVVVTTKPIHSLVAQVMEGVAVPQLIVEGAASAHTFSLRPSSARAVADAAIFVRVSDVAEPFTRKLVEGLPKDVTVLTLADERLGVKLLQQRSSGAFEAHHHDEPEHEDEHEHDLDHDHVDGHIWLDPQNAVAVIRAVASALTARWPQHQAVFNANAANAIERLDALNSEIAGGIAPLKGRPYVVFHDAYQYFEAHFGLPAAGAITLSPDQPPSARRLTDVRGKLKSLEAVCVFAEPGFQPNLLAAVTEGAPVRSGSLDPEGQMLNPGPQLYEQLLRNMLHDLQACLTRT